MTARSESGYIALLAVLVIGAAATAIGLTLLTTGTDSQRSSLVEQQSKQAQGLAAACAEEALQQIHDSPAFSFAGTNGLTLGQGTCTYQVTVTSSTTSTIMTSGTVGNVVKKIRVYVTIGSSSISITSWQEIS